jgi:hypothetical protein
MTIICKDSTLLEVAVAVSDALDSAGITATLSGGGAVSIYSDNQYQSHDLDFVTAAVIAELEPVLVSLGFIRTNIPRLSQFEHPLVEWFLEFPPAPLTFGNRHVDHSECAVIHLSSAKLRIVTPTQSIMDRLAAAFAWQDPQSRDQAILVAVKQDIDWEDLQAWFKGEGETEEEYQRFRAAVSREITKGDS